MTLSDLVHKLVKLIKSAREGKKPATWMSCHRSLTAHELAILEGSICKVAEFFITNHAKGVGQKINMRLKLYVLT